MNLEIPQSLLFSIALIIIVATILALIAKRLRQQIIPAYIITGIILGPIGLKLISETQDVNALAEIGIAFLLFFIGLEINFSKLKQVIKVSLIGGLLQVLLTFLVSYFIILKLGFHSIEALYLGIVISFSSTMVVVKLLSDSDRLDTLHARIIVGFLLIQDVIVILILSLTYSLNFGFSLMNLIISLLKGVILVLISLIVTKTILQRLMTFAAKSNELLFLTSITYCFSFAIIAKYFDYSIAIGAFIAGVGLASSTYNVQIIGSVRPLKDFFSTIFFVSLGMLLVLVDIKTIWPALTILLILILFIKPLIVYILTALFGYEKRTSFITAISLSQISEFSLILALQLVVLDLISTELLSITIFLLVITTSITPYLLDKSDRTFKKFQKFLPYSKKITIEKHKLEYMSRGYKKTIVLFGCHRMGGIFLKTLRKLGKRVLVIDHDPEIIKQLIKEKISCMYGDINNQEILDDERIFNSKIVISTSPDVQANTYLLEQLKIKNPKIKVFVTANHLHQAYEFYSKGADYVILPHILSGERISTMLRKILQHEKKLETIREQHLKHLDEVVLFKK